jgi:hypothetical protein
MAAAYWIPALAGMTALWSDTIAINANPDLIAPQLCGQLQLKMAGNTHA